MDNSISKTIEDLEFSDYEQEVISPFNYNCPHIYNRKLLQYDAEKNGYRIVFESHYMHDVSNKPLSHDSLIDAKNVRIYKKGANSDLKRVNTIKSLTEFGIDTNEKLYLHYGYYRGFDNKMALTLALIGKERTDKEWIESGNASLEVYCAASKYKDMNIEISCQGLRNGVML